MKQRPYTLTRVEDGQEWPTVARSAGEAVSALRYETHLSLFLILEPVGDFILTSTNQETGVNWQFGVTQGTPKYESRVFAKTDGTYAISLRRKKDGFTYLSDASVETVDAGLELLEAAFEKYSVPADECELVRPAHAEGGD